MRGLSGPLTFLLALLAGACGGSSSETPWPLEPDPRASRHPPKQEKSSMDGGIELVGPAAREALPPLRGGATPAPPTWGGPPPKRPQRATNSDAGSLELK